MGSSQSCQHGLRHYWLRFLNSLAVPLVVGLLGAASSGLLAETAQIEQLDTVTARPGETSPIGSPNNLTLFNVDSIGLLASQNTVTYSALLNFAPQDAGLKQWTMSGATLQTNDPCTETPRRRLGHGRVSTPKFEQAICITQAGVVLYTSPPPVFDGSYVDFKFKRPGIGGANRNFAVAAGEMSPRPGTDELPHQNIVAAYANLDQVLEIDVVGWDSPGPGVPGTLELTASYVGPDNEKVSGDVAVTLGDFNNDGILEILTASDISRSAEGPGEILLAVFSYEPEAGKLVKRSQYTVKTASPPRSLTLASGDFRMQGSDQVILGFAPTAQRDVKPTLQLQYFELKRDLEIVPPLLTQQLTDIATGSFFSVAPGLFWFDPKASPDFAFRVRQLAVAYAATDGTVWGQVVGITAEPPRFVVGRAVTLSAPGETAATNGIGPALAVGNFIGLKSAAVQPLEQMAVTLPIPAEQAGMVKPQLLVATVSGQDFQIAPVWRNTMPTYATSGIVLDFPTIAYDIEGVAFYLGSPAHIQVPGLIDPQYVIEMPPRHIDCLPNPEGGDCQIVNLAGFSYEQFYVELRDSQNETLQQTTTDTMNSQFGSSVSATVSGTVSAGLMGVGYVEVSNSVKTAFSYETTDIQTRVNKNYRQATTEKTAQTSHDDHLIVNARYIDIWRYPVYGLNLEQSKQNPYYDFIIPGPRAQFSGGGRNFEWYGPRHQNYNAISYPEIGGKDLGADIGKFTTTVHGEKKTEQIPLNEPLVRFFDGNQQTYDLSFTEAAGESASKSFQYTLANSLDVTVGLAATAFIKLFSGTRRFEGFVGLNSRSSWEKAVLAEREVQKSRGVRLNQPSVSGGIPDKAYSYKTLVYITGDGGFKVAHGTDVLASETGRAWWKKNYGGKPDPALNLPNRLEYDQQTFQWQLNPGESYFWMRGIAATQAEPDPEGAYAYLPGAVTAGTPVRLEVRVSNYSVDTDAKDVAVSFAYQTLNPKDCTPEGGEHVFATSAPVTIGPRGLTSVAAVLNTDKLGGLPYRFVINLVPDSRLKGKVHGETRQTGGYNRGTWPWSSCFWVFNKPSDRAELGEPPSAPSGMTLDLLPVGGATGSRGSVTHDATVRIKMPSANPGLRHLIVAAVGEDEQREALAARLLYGLAAGENQLTIPVQLPKGASRVIAWLSPTGGTREPVSGWVVPWSNEHQPLTLRRLPAGRQAKRN